MSEIKYFIDGVPIYKDESGFPEGPPPGWLWWIVVLIGVLSLVSSFWAMLQ